MNTKEVNAIWDDALGPPLKPDALAAYEARQRDTKKREEEIARLRQIITEYARHNEGCSAAHGDQYRCRCGWREVEPEFK